jgi:hypothetical protein
MKSIHLSAWLEGILFVILLGLLLWGIQKCSMSIDGFANPPSTQYQTEKEYKIQAKAISDRYTPLSGAKRPVIDAIESSHMPESHQCLVNFYALGCRFPGFIGPKENGYMDLDLGVQTAVAAGCRVFVLDIDYIPSCGSSDKAFPQLVVRDIQGKLQINENSNMPLCNNEKASNLKTLCERINTYAFSSSAQNASDPLILVLYFHRVPQGSYKSKEVLDYYSKVARALAPLKNRFLKNEMEGGTYYRQKQEGRLLMNPITTYNGKVLVFTNANTSGFREVQTYSSYEDLDYITNLRLSYTQTKLGVTENDSGSTFGVLQTVDDYLNTPPDRTDQIVEQTKMRWSICFPREPLDSVPADQFIKLSKSFGVHCVPALLFDSEDKNGYLFQDQTFRKHAFVPKPVELRYVKPPTVTPAEPNPSMNANQGKLRAPQLN